MDINEIFKSSDAIKCEDLGGRDIILTVKAVEIATFNDDDNKKRKPILSFLETDKTFVCNKVNSMSIGDSHGYETEHWPGKKITMYPSRTSFGGSMVDCIRIRPPIASTTAPVQGLPEIERKPGGMGNASLGHVSQDVPPPFAEKDLDDEIPF